MNIFDKLMGTLLSWKNQNGSPKNNNGIVINGNGNSIYHPSSDIHYPDLTKSERMILNYFAEGGRGAIAEDESGCIIQINIYGIPGIDPNAHPYVSGEDLAVFRTLAGYGLIKKELKDNGHAEYAITPEGFTVHKNFNG